MEKHFLMNYEMETNIIKLDAKAARMDSVEVDLKTELFDHRTLSYPCSENRQYNHLYRVPRHSQSA